MGGDAVIKRVFLKCCISNNIDGTEDDVWEEAANDGDSDVDFIYPELDKELHAVFEESIDEDFLRFS